MAARQRWTLWTHEQEGVWRRPFLLSPSESPAQRLSQVLQGPLLTACGSPGVVLPAREGVLTFALRIARCLLMNKSCICGGFSAFSVQLKTLLWVLMISVIRVCELSPTFKNI